MRLFPALLLLVTVVSCAPATEAPRTARQRAAILGGAAAASDVSTFLLDLRFDNNTASICTAVLISPRVLLTAAHCVDPVFHGAANVTVRAMNEPDTSMLMMSDTILVTTIARHPSWNRSEQESRFDLAALLLASPPGGVTPVPLGALPANPVGQSVRALGYGRLTAGDGSSSGTRRAVTASISATTSTYFDFGSSAEGLCAGDSGGPSFLGATLVGIHSRARGGACGVGVDIRVDAHRGFIDGFVAANDAPLCSMDGRCGAGCSSPDPDCPCAADSTCNATCGASDPDCRCVGNGMCGAACGATDPDCCGSDGACDAACGMSDPDCRCAGDGTCVAGCGTSDADCCGRDGTCDMACGASDGDCSRCLADGRCDPSCMPTDVDCTGCVADGACEPSCGISDEDCLDDGAVCQDASACWGGECVADPRGFRFCSRTCSDDSVCINDTTCQAGLCRAAGEQLGGVAGGCSTGADWVALAALAWVRRRRRVR